MEIPAPSPSTEPSTEPSSWTGHVVVAGLHAEGLRAVQQLRAAGVRAVVVEPRPDPALLRALEATGAVLVRGEPSRPEVLAEAGLAGASALLCVEDDDLATLATALHARAARADLRVVAQLGNAPVGRALAGTGVAVLDVAALSAPAVVQACLATPVRSLEVGGRELRVLEVEAHREGALRELFGDLAPLAVVDGRDGTTALSPGRDRVVAEGDLVVLVGTEDDVRAARASLPGLRQTPEHRSGQMPDQVPAFVGARAPRAARHRPSSLLRTLAGALDARLRLALTALGGLGVLSVVVLLSGYREADGTRMSLLDAVYFTVETVATVGFGDFYFRDQAWWLRLWAVALMLVGATLATVFFALLTNALVTRRLEEGLGRRRVTALDAHVIVVGLGSVGIAVVRHLRGQDVPVLVVDPDPANRYAAAAREVGAQVLTGDATQPEVLSAAGLERARAVAVLTSDDLVNVEAGLALKDLLGERWWTVPVVLRVADPGLATALGGALGFRHVRSTAALSAPWFVGAALGLEVLGTFYAGAAPLLVARLSVSAGGGLDGAALADLPQGTRVLGLLRAGGGAGGAVELSPRSSARLAAGDRVHLVGPSDELVALLRSDGVRRTAPAP
ncbi:NAD-binding protein [Quadrisphaera granulorum]|uniref:NAD-binding protein n=1 Tax=Quadrisphaera granulorum TaxID=317664 RepID=UPI00147326D8|nr:NAD-binding protein [Quadrisphaera granulorum]